MPNAPAGATGALSIGNLVLAADATLNVLGGGGSSFSSAPGNGVSNLYISSINGSSIPATITNRILPANIITNAGEFTTYVQSSTAGSNGQNYGVMGLNGFTTISQSQYDSNAATLPATNSNANVRLTTAGTVPVPSGGADYNVLALRANGITLNFPNPTDTLNLTAGGLALTSGTTTTIGSTVGNGKLTAGGTATGTIPLYLHSSGATINSVISNNTAGGAVRLIANSFSGTLALAAANTYSGGTVVNGGGTLTLSGAGTIPAGGLTINGSTVNTTLSNTANQIHSSNDVVLNGSANLNLGNFDNTLKSLTLNNTGGSGPVGVNINNSSLTLTDINAITVVNDNISTNPVISGNGTLTLPAGANINVSTTNQVPVSLTISSGLASAGTINKTGIGTLDLGGSGTYAGGFNILAGSVQIGINSTPTSGSVTSGPFGSGTLTMADGTALLSDAAGIRAIANAITLNGNITLGALSNANSVASSINGIILNGPLALGSGSARTINVNSLLNVSTIGGIISGSGSSLAKTGPGTLVVTGNNTYSGGTFINGGVLQTNSTGLGSSGSITFGGGILRHAASTATDFSSRFSAASNQPIYIDTNGQTISYASAITSASGGSLGKFGTGTLILTNTATFDGATIIADGTLQIGTGGTTGDIPTATNIANNSSFVWNRSNDDSLTGIISGNGSVTKLGPLGAGTLTLSGINTYTGVTTISAGTLSIAQLANGGLSSGIGASSNAAANLVFDGGTLNYTGGTEATDRNFTISAGKTATIQVSTDTTNLSLSGTTPATTGGLAKSGTGTLTVTSSQVYTGPTTISGGTLALSGNGSLADTSTVSIANASTFNIAGINRASESVGSLSGASGSSIVLGNHTIDFGGDNTSFSVASDISGSGGGITKSGSGTISLSGNNSYSGNTNLVNGTMLLGSSNALPAGAALSLSAGTTLNSGGYSQSTGALSVGGSAPASGAIIDLAGGDVELTFADLSIWTGLLSVWNYSGSVWTEGTDKLIFTSGSNSINLEKVQFYTDSGVTEIGIGGGLIGNELIPVPEPTPSATAMFMLSLLGYRERRRLLHRRG